jgi:hypothetical protein
MGYYVTIAFDRWKQIQAAGVVVLIMALLSFADSTPRI